MKAKFMFALMPSVKKERIRKGNKKVLLSALVANVPANNETRNMADTKVLSKDAR
jgi:hypothetical protein